ncbi:peptide chain release factor N(5)-glutamine methyltransferase [Candidatus Neomarinimicrobiota bacterium]
MSTNPAKTWQIIDLIKWGSDYFAQHGIENARMEIEWLLSHHLGVQRVDLYVQYDRSLSPQELAGFKSLIMRRVSGEPFQYILGVAPFYGRDFKVTRAVLIPRPESEILIQVLRKGPPPTSILDIGTGSGCLAITAALLYPDASTFATDISQEALEVSRENAEELGAVEITFQQLDVLTALPDNKFDAILCNPPYVAAKEIPDLQREIREHEPSLAITDHADGLTFHRRLADVGKFMLRQNGRMLVEVGGSAQAEGALSIYQKAGAQVLLHQDLQGDDRVCEVCWENGGTV